MRVIDLIPPDVHARRDEQQHVRHWARRLGLFALVAALAFGSLYWLVQGRKSELISLADRHDWLRERMQRAGSLLEERTRLASTQQAISLVSTDRTAGWLIGVLESTMPPEIYLRSLVIERCPPPDPAGKTLEGQDRCFGSMKFRGIAPNHGRVGLLIQKLITVGIFSEVALVSARDTGQQVEFEIICKVEGEGSMPAGRGYGKLRAERPYE